MLIDDFVMLGKAHPIEHGDGRKFVCSAGFSKELGFIRIYPLSIKDSPKRWSINKVELERNPKDNRSESWKIKGDRSPVKHILVNKCFTKLNDVHESEKLELVQNAITQPRSAHENSVEYLNSRYLSLGIIFPIEPPQLFYKDDKPYLRVIDDCPPKQGYRNMQIGEWGVWIYKEENNKEITPDGLRLKTNPPLFVGNMNAHRNVWLVISILRGKYWEKKDCPLFPELQTACA
jgi:hypothetical protein